jgi:hypothetical protein
MQKLQEQFPELHANCYFYKLSILQISNIISVDKDFSMESLQLMKVHDNSEYSETFHEALVCK